MLRYEKFFAKKIDYGLCVSNSMREDLRQDWSVDARVVYDKPNTQIFRPISLEEKHEIYKKLSLIPEKPENKDDTLFTILKDGAI